MRKPFLHLTLTEVRQELERRGYSWKEAQPKLGRLQEEASLVVAWEEAIGIAAHRVLGPEE